MTSLYLDTNIGCLETKITWTAKDERRTSLLSMIRDFFR